MTPQERQLVDDLFDRLSKVENAPRDPDASAAIAQGLRSAPNAIYALVQTVLLQDEALKRANSRIQELEQARAPEQSQSGSFLGTAAAAAAGMVGGSLLLNGIRSMMGGGHHQAFGDTNMGQERAATPWSDQSNSSLARDAGINDIGLAQDHADDTRRAGVLDQASNDDDNRDDMDLDADDV